MNGNATRLYFIVSGEHPTLPRAELLAILDTLGVPYSIGRISYKLVEVKADPSCLMEVVRRGGFVDESGMLFFHSNGDYESIADSVKAIDLEGSLSEHDGFSVRIDRFGEDSAGVPTMKLESFVGALLKERSGAKVDLHRPSKQFRGFLTGGEFYLGQMVHSRARGSVRVRLPRKRPAFHPSTMTPKLARCMVNLSHAREGGVFLDPFCGVGGILIEACLVGSLAVGVDALAKMLRGARRNLAHFGSSPLGLIRGDARKLPIGRVDAIATDPPYGTGASTLRSTTRKILEHFLPQARNVLRLGSRLVAASPVGTLVPDLAEENGFRILDRHQAYVHRSLTREILVMGAV
jgi:tRNA (guanine10-N2)-dimethyltransferase